MASSVPAPSLPSGPPRSTSDVGEAERVPARLPGPGRAVLELGGAVARAGAVGAGGRAVARRGVAARPVQHLVPAVLRRAAEVRRDELLAADRQVRLARRGDPVRPHLSGVLAADAPDPLAPLADGPLRRRLDDRSELLPPAALRDRRR